MADLTISAQVAAQKGLMAADGLARLAVKLAEFEASGFDRADFPDWEEAYNAQMALLTSLIKQPSAATIAAQATAQPKA